MTNPNNAVGTNGALNGRTSVNALNDVLACFTSRGILQGWEPQAGSAMTITIGGAEGVRDVAIAEDPVGNKTTVNNISAGPIPVDISTASTDISRIDAVVAYVNNPTMGNPNETDNPAATGLIAVIGGAGVAPTESQIRTAITADGGTGTTAYYVVLATVVVPQNATAVGTVTRGERVGLSIAQSVQYAATTGNNEGVAMSQKATTTALGTKVNIVQTAGPERVYGVTTAGAQTMTAVATEATANTLSKRGTDGTLIVGAPTATNHAATKGYADTKATITVTSTDPGEGVTLTANNFIAVTEEN